MQSVVILSVVVPSYYDYPKAARWRYISSALAHMFCSHFKKMKTYSVILGNGEKANMK